MTGLAVFCSDKIDFRSRKEQFCPTTADETTPYFHPHFRKLLGKWLFSQFRAIFIFFVFSLIFLGAGDTWSPTSPPRTPTFAQQAIEQLNDEWCDHIGDLLQH